MLIKKNISEIKNSSDLKELFLLNKDNLKFDSVENIRINWIFKETDFFIYGIGNKSININSDIFKRTDNYFNYNYLFKCLMNINNTEYNSKKSILIKDLLSLIIDF